MLSGVVAAFTTKLSRSMNDDVGTSRTLAAPLIGAAILLSIVIVLLVLRSPAKPLPKPPAGNPAEESPYTPPEEGGFVGSDRCAECHQEIYASYSQHPMYGSTRAIREDTSRPPSSSVALAGTQRSLAATATNDSMLHHERMHDAEGKLIYNFSVAMDFVVGSGRRAQAYLYQRDNLICSSPLNWFKNTGWGLNPGFVSDDPRRFDRRTTAECLTCHAGHLAQRTRGVDEFQKPPFHEAAIGCERCHGPGQAHAEFHELSQTGTDPILQMAELTSRKKNAICYQCHFSAKNRVLRTQRSVTDFRPGMDVEDVWSFTRTKPTVDANGRATNLSTAHVQQMHESVCFTRSEGRLSCISCHDPHGTPSATDRVQFYRKRCLSCHEQQACLETPKAIEAAGGSCIDCHMPKRDTTVATHVAQTDHRVLRSPSANPSLPKKDQPMVAFFDDHDKRLPTWELRRAIALMLARAAGPFSITLEDEFKALTEHFQEDPEVVINYGSICQSRRNYPEAISAFQQAAKFEATAARAYEALMQITYEAREFEQALKYADAYIAISPYSALVHAIRGDCLNELGRTSEAVESIKRCIKLNPSIIQVQQVLADLYGELGMTDKQQAQQNLVERMKTARPSADVSDLQR